MPLPWEKKFWTGERGGTDIWDIMTQGRSELVQQAAGGENYSDTARNIGTGVKKAWEDVTGVTAADAAERAAQMQIESGEEARGDLLQMFDRSREDMQPWLESGRGYMEQLEGMMNAGQFDPRSFSAPEMSQMGDISQDPGYQFEVDQMTKAVRRGAAGAGGLKSGATDRELSDYISGLASTRYNEAFQRNMMGNEQEYNQAFNTFGANRSSQMDFFNQLAGLSGQGQTQSSNMGALSSNFAPQFTGLTTGMGNAAAAGTIGSANARTQGTQNLLNMLMQGGALFFGG